MTKDLKSLQDAYTEAILEIVDLKGELGKLREIILNYEELLSMPVEIACLNCNSENVAVKLRDVLEATYDDVPKELGGDDND